MNKALISGGSESHATGQLLDYYNVAFDGPGRCEGGSGSTFWRGRLLSGALKTVPKLQKRSWFWSINFVQYQSLDSPPQHSYLPSLSGGNNRTQLAVYPFRPFSNGASGVLQDAFLKFKSRVGKGQDNEGGWPWGRHMGGWEGGCSRARGDGLVGENSEWGGLPFWAGTGGPVGRGCHVQQWGCHGTSPLADSTPGQQLILGPSADIWWSQFIQTAVSEHHRLRDLGTTDIYCSHLWRLKLQDRGKVLVDPMSGDSLPAFWFTDGISLCSHMRRGLGSPCRVSLMRTLILFTGAPPL